MTFSEMFHFPGRSSKNDKVIKIKSWIKDRCSKVFFFFYVRSPEDIHRKILFFVDVFHLSNWGTYLLICKNYRNIFEIIKW